MTVAHKVLHRYIDQNFERGFFDVKDLDPDKVMLRDRQGDSITLTLNVYCDILDANTNEIYAVSDLPHDLIHIGAKTPNTWKELERKKRYV